MTTGDEQGNNGPKRKNDVTLLAPVSQEELRQLRAARRKMTEEREAERVATREARRAARSADLAAQAPEPDFEAGTEGTLISSPSNPQNDDTLIGAPRPVWATGTTPQLPSFESSNSLEQITTQPPAPYRPPPAPVDDDPPTEESRPSSQPLPASGSPMSPPPKSASPDATELESTPLFGESAPSGDLNVFQKSDSGVSSWIPPPPPSPSDAPEAPVPPPSAPTSDRPSSPSDRPEAQPQAARSRSEDFTAIDLSPGQGRPKVFPKPKPTSSSKPQGGTGWGLVLLFVMAGAAFGAYQLFFKAQHGLLYLRTMPSGAALSVDGELQAGRSPLELKLRPGAHVIEVELDGYSPESLQIQMTEHEIIDRDLVLSPISRKGLMTVSIQVEVDSPVLIVDGNVFEGQRLLKLGNMDPGAPHEIRIQAKGYTSMIKKIEAGALRSEYFFALDREADVSN